MNNLKDIRVKEISLVKRGAVRGARIALAKADDDVEEGGEQLAPALRMRLEHRLDKKIAQGRLPDESVVQATERLLRTDREIRDLYEEIAQAHGAPSETAPSENLGFVTKSCLEAELEELIDTEREAGESRAEAAARLLKTDERAQSLYEVIETYDTHAMLYKADED